MDTQYDAQYFIEKFEAIPEDRWTTGEYVNSSKQCCALGHCGFRNNKNQIWTPEGEALVSLFDDGGLGIIDGVNDGHDPRYRQPTPKQRVLAALRDAKERGL